jgi:succinate dehydrogenase hydrophobic anchor subunit
MSSRTYEEYREKEAAKPPRYSWLAKLLSALILFALVCACVAVAIGSVAAAVAGFRYVFGL